MTTDFFAHQEQARRHTGLLLFYFVLAVVGIVVTVYALVAAIFLQDQPSYFNPQLFLIVSTGTVVLIVLGSIFKSLTLWQGGPQVALMLGGRQIQQETRDPEERRLLNIVEEMAIASGVPVPPVFVMDHEPGINAFAAGFSPSDAVVAVNRGTLRVLKRDELQGVVAHEFSHILNGDMRLNLRLMGWLHGILLIFMIGRIILEITSRSSNRSRSSSDDNKGGNAGLAFFLLALGLMAIGSIGVFFGRLIKAAVSRQREFLADASAVQFTRNPDGISGALKKIGGYMEGSRIHHQRAEEASHLFFANGLSNWSALLATHPPLTDRIRQIDPNFDGLFPQISPELIAEIEQQAQQESAQPSEMRFAPSEAVPAHDSVALSAANAPDQVGQLDTGRISRSRAVLAKIPAQWRSYTQDPFSARGVVLSWLVSADPTLREQQTRLMSEQLERPLLKLIDQLVEQMPQLPVETRIPLIDAALPALRQLSPNQYQRFRTVVKGMIDADGNIDVFEYVLQRMLIRHLDRVYVQRPLPKIRFKDPEQVFPAVVTVLGTMALAGTSTEEEATVAFQTGVGEWHSQESNMPLPQSAELGLKPLDESLRQLAQGTPELKQRTLQACAACLNRDGRVTLAEAELFRGIADALDCPVGMLTVTSAA